MKLESKLLNFERLMWKTLYVDRIFIRRELSRIRILLREKSTDREVIENLLLKVQTRIDASIKIRVRRENELPKPTYMTHLPITCKKDEIISKIKKHQVLIIEGETGSGKTTQLPKFVLAAGRGVYGRIACTQPRRIAAISVASRIKEEMGKKSSAFVGYKIRFKNRVPENAYIKVMTDGVLLAEAHVDPWFNEYDTIIVDEAHERNLNIDIIFGILRNLLPKRKNLKLIIVSATLDTEKISKAFNGAPLVSVSGRLYPVTVSYLSEVANCLSSKPVSYNEMAVNVVDNILNTTRDGDILVFMPTERDINEVCSMLLGRKNKNFLVFPLFARLDSKGHRKIFLSHTDRKIVVATNIAETSITIPGIKYVVDSGLARISKYLPQSRITSLPILPISKSSANQRKGRCGRVREGVCIRLYTELDYSSRSLFTQPEILRANLSEVILRMIALGIEDISSFPFIDRPSEKRFKDGFRQLIELGAIVYKRDKNGKIERKRVAQGSAIYELTRNGRIMSKLPLDPRLSRMLVEASREDCLEEAIIVASALSVGDLMERPQGAEQQADMAHSVFKDNLSDFVTFLNIWGIIHEGEEKYVSTNHIKKMCKRYFLSFMRVKEWVEIYVQIRTLVVSQKGFRTKIKLVRRQKLSKNTREKNIFSQLYKSLHKSILVGFLSNIAVKKDKYFFAASKEREVMIFPGSGLFNTKFVNWIVSAEFVKTTRLFVRCVAAIDPNWLEMVGGFLCKYLWSNPHWEKRRGEVIAHEQVSLFGLVIKRSRVVSYWKVNPEETKDIFIRRALVGGDVKEQLSFINFNRKLIDSVKEVENRVRRRDIFVGEESLVVFYKEQLKEVFDIKSLKSFINEKGNDNFLFLSKEDACKYYPNQEELNKFPESVNLGGCFFECSYFFCPGEDQDGITVNIPVESINCVKKERIGWLIPGLLYEKISVLVKGLNKSYRKKLIPLSETIDLIVKKMPRYREDILTALTQFISENFDVYIPPKDWPVNNLPEYLKMRIVLKDREGKVIVSERDESLLFKKYSNDICQDPPNCMKRRWEVDCVEEWNFGDLPEHVFYNSSSDEKNIFYPRLQVDSSSIKIKLFDNLEVAKKTHIRGVVALFLKHFKNDLKFLKKNIELPRRIKKESEYFGGLSSIKTQIYETLIEEYFALDILTRSDFQKHVRVLKEQKIFLKGEARCRQVLSVIESFHQSFCLITQMDRSYSKGSFFGNFSENMKKELFKLVPKNFIQLYNFEKINNLVRYISAIRIRICQCIKDPKRDIKRAILVQPYILSLDEIIKGMGHVTTVDKSAIVEEYFWMIEEYKVSIFAQELKTSFPISAKRLDRFLEKIKMKF